MGSLAVWTITWNRLDYTKRTFSDLHEKAGVSFDHYIVDNGSTDGTQEWLRKQFANGVFRGLILNSENRGVVGAVNQIWHTLELYDYILRLDNDCEIITDDILVRMIKVIKAGEKLIINPVIKGLVNPLTPVSYTTIAGERVSKLNGTGGIFRLMSNAAFKLTGRDEYEVPIHYKYDNYVNKVTKKAGFTHCRLEDCFIKHMDTSQGQAENKPEYIKQAVENRDTYL